jgi:adenylate cyclase
MKRRNWTPIIIALIIGAAVSVLRVFGGAVEADNRLRWLFRPLELLDLRALDFRFDVRGESPAAPEVVIVAIDDESITERGRWPWSRPTIARLIERISAGGAAVIGVDIVQSEATVECALARLDGGLDPECRAAVERALQGAGAEDQALVDAVRDSGRVVLG